ncbi:MAG: F0F1 ATP synthase subunit gamma, partial [Candidatus Dormibacteria bacterium]
MATLRDIRRHIRAVRNIEQMTRAMQMVSAAKMRRAQVRAARSRPYSEAMEEVAEDLSKTCKEVRSPYLVPRDSGEGLLVLVTSDRGLAGALNTNTIRLAHATMRRRFGPRYPVVALGRKGLDFAARNRLELIHHKVALPDRVTAEDLRPTVEAVVRTFLEREL